MGSPAADNEDFIDRSNEVREMTNSLVKFVLSQSLNAMDSYTTKFNFPATTGVHFLISCSSWRYQRYSHPNMAFTTVTHGCCFFSGIYVYT